MPVGELVLCLQLLPTRGACCDAKAPRCSHALTRAGADNETHLQAHGRLNMVSSEPCRGFIAAMAARAAEPGALDGNPHALGNVAWGLAVAQQLTPALLQQVRHRPIVDLLWL